MTRRSPSLLRFLRSRRLAVGLIAAVIGYSVVGTLVPQESAGASGVAEWLAAHPFLGGVTEPLGLHHAYSSPLFLALVGLLALSTAACAWERSNVALRRWRGLGLVSEQTRGRLEARPDVVVPVAAGSADALDRAEVALRNMGLKVRRGPRVIDAATGPAGLLGSPLFHWLLTVLFVTLALGWLTRAEGLVGIPVGSSVTDQSSSYGVITQGPLYPGHSGLRLQVSDLMLDYRDAHGVSHGPAPVVTLYRGNGQVARQRVFPNNPLRYGRLLIHMNSYGLAARLSLEASTAVNVGSVDTLLDFASTPSGTSRQSLNLNAAGGRVLYQITVTVPADREGLQVVDRLPRDPRVQVGLVGGSTVTLRPGGTFTLPSGYRLRLASLGYYARLSIADDGSVYAIYTLFVLAIVVMSLSVLVRHRRVLVVVAEGPDGPAFHAVLTRSGADPLFSERVDDALRDAAGEPILQEEGSS